MHTTGYAPGPPHGVRFANYPPGTSNPNYVFFEVSTEPMTMPTPLDQFPEIVNLTSKGYTKTEITVDGQRAIKLVQFQARINAAVYFIKGNYSYRIVLEAANGSLGQNNLNDFDLSVSTFKFY